MSLGALVAKPTLTHSFSLHREHSNGRVICAVWEMMVGTNYDDCWLGYIRLLILEILQVPTGFDYDPTSQQPVDRWTRAELNYGCVDFIASAEYMVRPPQPPAFVFVIDTSFRAIESGVIPIVITSILESLDNIPNEDGRTKVAIITVDNAVGFYKLVGDEPELLVVGDLSDVYLPRAAGDLLVDLTEAKTLLRDLLERMKTMYNETHVANNCLGVALQAAKKLLVR